MGKKLNDRAEIPFRTDEHPVFAIASCLQNKGNRFVIGANLGPDVYKRQDYMGEIPKDVKISLKSLKNTYGSFADCICKCIRKHDWFSLKMRLIFSVMKLFGQKEICLLYTSRCV